MIAKESFNVSLPFGSFEPSGYVPTSYRPSQSEARGLKNIAKLPKLIAEWNAQGHTCKGKVWAASTCGGCAKFLAANRKLAAKLPAYEPRAYKAMAARAEASK